MDFFELFHSYSVFIASYDELLKQSSKNLVITTLVLY